MTLLSNNINGAQHVNIKAIYKKSCSCILHQSTKIHTITTRTEKYGEVVNKLFIWALVRRVVSTPVFIEEEASVEYLTPWSGKHHCYTSQVYIIITNLSRKEVPSYPLISQDCSPIPRHSPDRVVIPRLRRLFWVFPVSSSPVLSSSSLTLYLDDVINSIM